MIKAILYYRSAKRTKEQNEKEKRSKKNPSRDDKETPRPIYIRVIRNGKASYITMNKSIAPKLWDDATGKAKKNYIGHEDLNERIENKIAELNKAEDKLLKKHETITAREVIAKTERGEDANIFVLAKTFIQRFNNKRQAATYMRYETHLNKLLMFISQVKGITEPKLNFDRIDPEFLEEFDQWLAKGDIKKKRKPLGKNTRWTVFKNLRSLFNYAIDKRVVSLDSYPFRAFELPSEENEHTVLNEEQIVKLIETGSQYDEYSTERAAVATFALQLFMQGCRAGDVLALCWSEISNDLTQVSHRIRKSEGKKKEQWLRLTLPPQAVSILRFYKEYNDGLDKPSKYVMPYMKDVEYDDLPRAISTATAVCNEALKRVYIKAGLPLKNGKAPISSHCARRSYATRTARTKGILTTQELLKHSNISMSRRYVQNMANDQLSLENAEIGSFIPALL
jgi:integrase